MSFSRRTFPLEPRRASFAACAVPAAARDPDDWPNVFISPMGKPFRAKLGAPYPVADWFKAADKDGDGKLDHAEFMADAGAFFDVLDLNHDGALNSYEVAAYEHNVAPEILGYNVPVSDLRGAPSLPGLSLPGNGGARLWLAQHSPRPRRSDWSSRTRPPPKPRLSPRARPPSASSKILSRSRRRTWTSAASS